MFTTAKLLAAATVALGVLAVQYIDRQVFTLPRF